VITSRRLSTLVQLRPSMRPNLNVSTMAGCLIAAFWILVAVLAPLISPSDPLRQSADLLQSPSWSHFMGTDELGRDVLSRLIYGSRVTLPYATAVVLISATIGSFLGGVAGYFGGLVDGAIMRVADLIFAFPAIVLAMAVTAALGPGLLHALEAIAIVSWPSYARITRSLVITAIQSEYVAAARLLGASSIRVLVRDVAPNILGPIVVIATLGMGHALLLLASLSFLGLGAQPPNAEWGLMISSGIQTFNKPWLSVFPGLAVFSAAAAFNLIGDGIGKAFNPMPGRSTSLHSAPSAPIVATSEPPSE
jgi:ABC-type dipeptide/oligopeptide/nickel transport system permease subunit